MKRLMIGIALGVAAVVAGVLAYRHFVTDQVTDKGGMENPFLLEFPQDAALQGLDWTRNAMNGDDCFSFSLRQEDGQCYGSCDFAQGGGARLSREDAPLTAENWAAVEQCLKDSPHTPKQEPGQDGVIAADETVDRLTAVWKTPEGEAGRGEYEGGDEDALRTLLQTIFAQTPDAYAPQEAE